MWSITERRMGVREEEVLGSVGSSMTSEVRFFFHLVNFQFIDVFS